MNELHFENTDTLYFSRVKTSGLYVNSHHQPIWPICTDSEEALLKQICMYNGISLKQEIEVKQDLWAYDDEWVAAIESEIAEDAALYAHLTGRKFKLIKDIDQLQSLKSLRVFVFTPALLGFELLVKLMNLNVEEEAPGMLCSDKANMRMLALTKAALSHTTPKRISHQLEIHWDLPINSVISDDGRIFLGKLANEKDIRRFLIDRPTILLYRGESDGVDAYLTENALICDIRRRKIYENQPYLSRCLTTKHCHRLNISIDEAAKTSRIISPEEMHAQVVLWVPCWGTFPPPSINARFGVGFRLGEVLTTGALISTIGGTIRYTGDVQSLLHDLHSGLTVGKAVANYNSSLNARKLDQKLYFFGDPKCRIGTVTHNAVSPFSNQNSHFTEEKIPDLAFLQELIDLTSAASDSCITSDLETAKNAIDLYQAENRKQILTRKIADETVYHLQNTILNYFANSEPALILTWLKTTDIYADNTLVATCPICDNNIGTTTYIAHFNLPWLPARTVIRCPQCGFSSDKPINVNMEIKYVDNTFIIKGNLLNKRCSACVVTMQGDIERITEFWPRKDILIQQYSPRGLQLSNTFEFFILFMCETQLIWFHGYPRIQSRKFIDTEKKNLATEVV